MMTMAMSSLIRESTRIDKLERSMNVVHLESTIEYLEFGGTLYKDLSDNEKILCIISDFFLATKGNYSINDIMMLKPMMDKIGVNPNDKISMLSLYETLNSNDKIADKLFEALDKAKLKELDDIYIPLLGNLQKIESLKNEEKYIVDSVVEMSKSSEQDVQFSLLKSYANNNLNMDLEKENSYFDLSVAIINELRNIDNVEIAETEEINIKKIPASAQNYYDKAVEYYDKAIKLEKDNALAYYNKAEALDKSDCDKNRFLVEECLNKAIAFDSRYGEKTKYTSGEFFKNFSHLECYFDINSENEFELLKRLNSFI